jgi:Zn-dependent M28 family amino/carboxypeptidase
MNRRRPEPSPAPPAAEERLRDTVRFLSIEAGPRWHRNPEALDRAASWIEARLRETGLDLATQEYALEGRTFRNVLAWRAGLDASAGLVIVGAHYDAFGGLPGADDNASGVAALLEVARGLPAAVPRRTQVLAAFVNEEPPLFASDAMGSAHYAEKLLAEGARVELMVALDALGYFSDEPGSQRFPIPGLGLLYPDRGNFLAVVGDLAAGRWIRTVARGMRAAGTIPVVSFRAPAIVPGVHFSDHLPFRRRGLPGVLVTDTAFLRNPHYHLPTDTIETLDFPRLGAAVQALHGVLAEADR